MRIIYIPPKPAAPKKSAGDYVLELVKTLLTFAGGCLALLVFIGLLIEAGIIGG